MAKNHLKGFIAGALVMLLLTGAVTIAATSNGAGFFHEIHHGISVVLNGRPAEFPEDSQPFVMNDRTYLPLRAMADLLDLPVDFDPDTNTAYVGYACISELIIGTWREVDVHLWQMFIEFRADGTGIVYEILYRGYPGNRRYVEEFVWHMNDGTFVLEPLNPDEDRLEIEIAVFRDLLSNAEIMRFTIIYNGEVDEIIMLERIAY